MSAFNRRKRCFTADNMTHLCPLQYNQPRPDDSDSEIVRPRHRGIYLLSGAFTTVVLLAGSFAIVQAMNLNFGTVVTAIFAAMVLDSMDDRVARITNTQSALDE